MPRPQPIITLISVGISLLFAHTSVAQQTLPKWEFGLGPSFIHYPDYPGSDQSNTLVVPFPYITYRGDDFQIDQREVKKPLQKWGRAELDLSATGSIPVASDDNEAREGMDDLDATLGIGPVFKYRLYQHDLNELKLEWPVYGILATDFSQVSTQGWRTSPGLYYYFRRNLPGKDRLKLTLSARAEFASQSNNAYFYGVSTQDARPGRPTYQADGGLASLAYGASFNWHVQDLWVGGFVIWRDLSPAVIEDSPLVDTHNAVTFGMGLTWNFYQSDETVQGLE
ncbi:MipA/OmpV family protein [Hydrogenovibrio halophilus]|uniref:MipA/OmpV family protein n=1 Tax=Hydrogenovibrio halophilus TaxID=373391 RepID=UPI0009FE2E63|nr:MipA/OmpV family protein [Hydrogenovibrio halophilus]